MAQNPNNAIIHLGHSNGTVTLWSPNMTEPLVKMLCHRGPVQAIAMDGAGTYMATAGLDGQLKVWDIRTYKPVHEYFTQTPASALSISQRGLLGVSYGPHVAVWKDAFREKQQSPYMTHLLPGKQIVDINFCAFEDVLAIGHSGGLSSIVVPGSGEPNYDSLEANPFETKKQRRETEVKQLLDKVSFIVLAFVIG
jgi:U3 small nucleolar RNA-associated protein 7